MRRKILKSKPHFPKGQVDLHKVWLIAGISIGVLALLFFVLFSSRDALFGKAVDYTIGGTLYQFGVNVNCPVNAVSGTEVRCELELVSKEGVNNVNDEVEAIEFTIEGEFMGKEANLVTPIATLENGGFLTNFAGTSSDPIAFVKGMPIMVSYLQMPDCIDNGNCPMMPAGVFGHVNVIVGINNNVHLENVKIVVKEGESYVDVCFNPTSGSCDNGVVSVALSLCGNGVFDAAGNDGTLGNNDDEECDGGYDATANNWAGGYSPASCSAIGLGFQSGGTLACGSDCKFDTSQCIAKDTTETSCIDGRDNDLDLATDCADGDCNSESICSTEVCADDFDNDGDGIVDCEDSDCTDHSACEVEMCTNGVDDDDDDFVDCADPDCEEDSSCEVIVVLGDVNGDGAITSLDSLLTLKYSLSLTVPPSFNVNAAEVNSCLANQNIINSLDALMILKKSLDLDITPGNKEFPC